MKFYDNMLGMSTFEDTENHWYEPQSKLWTSFSDAKHRGIRPLPSQTDTQHPELLVAPIRLGAAEPRRKPRRAKAD